MGQSVVALMYGINSNTKGLRDEHGEPFWHDHSTPGKHLDWDDAPRTAYEGEVVGFAVACSNGQDVGEGCLGETCLVADIERQHAKYIKVARKKWDTFAAWALKEHGKKLPPAALWITTDERA